MGVVMEHDEIVSVGGCGDHQIGQGNSSVLAALGELRLEIEGAMEHVLIHLGQLERESQARGVEPFALARQTRTERCEPAPSAMPT